MKPFPYLLERLPQSGGPARRINIDLQRTCHALIIGASGQGKTMAAALLTAKIAIYISPAKAWILDFKGDEFFDYLHGIDGIRYFSYKDCVDGLKDFYAMFEKRLSGDSDKSYRLLWIDELSAMILSLPKKEADNVKAMLASVLMMGRSLNCFVLTSVQRASAELFSQGSRDNYGINFALGNLSRESAFTLGFEQERMVPVTKIGGGHLILNGGTQIPVQTPIIDGNGLKRMKEAIQQIITA